MEGGRGLVGSAFLDNLENSEHVSSIHFQRSLKHLQIVSLTQIIIHYRQLTGPMTIVYLIQHMPLNYVSCDMIVTYVITLPIVSQFLYQSYIAFYTRLLNVTRFDHMLLIRIVYLHDLLTQPKSGFYLIEAYLNDTGFK